MAIEHKVWNFPTFPISKQLFHVPGAAADGGFTSGGARITSPEPGGFSVLEIQPSLQTGEWEYPLSSWLMSKTNGQILRVRLAPTPQIAGVRSLKSTGVPWAASPGYREGPWANQQNWDGDSVVGAFAGALEGTNVLAINVTGIGQLFRHGHVIGHAGETYLIDDINYDGDVAFAVVTPPIRRNIAAGENLLIRPYFTGSIANPGDFRNTYDAENVGNIQLNKIVMNEVIL